MEFFDMFSKWLPNGPTVILVEVGISALKVFILGEDWGTKTALELILIQIELFQIAVLVTEWLSALGA